MGYTTTKLSNRVPTITEQNRKWWVVVAIGIAGILVSVDFNGLTVALPTIGRDLGISTTGLQWTINAYLLAFAAPMVAFGRLSDIFGRRRVLLVGIVVFIVASAFAGLSQSELWLVSARVIQGLGAAAFFAASLPIVSNAFPEKERGKGIALWAAISGLGLAAGPLVGGVLTQMFSWRWFFFFNIPLATVAVVLTLVAVAFLFLTRTSPAGGLTTVLVSLVLAGTGIGVAYTLSNTVGMAALPEAKGGEASGVLGMVRLLGAVFGIAVTGALFKTLENEKLTELLVGAGAALDSSDRREIKGLLSGSDAAEATLKRLAPEVESEIVRIVHETFVSAFGRAMLLCAAVAMLGVLTAHFIIETTQSE